MYNSIKAPLFLTLLLWIATETGVGELICTFSEERDTAGHQHDWRGFKRVAGPSSCQQFCQSVQLCTAVEYSYRRNFCYMYKGPTTLSQSPGHLFMLKKCKTVTTVSTTTPTTTTTTIYLPDGLTTDHASEGATLTEDSITTDFVITDDNRSLSNRITTETTTSTSSSHTTSGTTITRKLITEILSTTPDPRSDTTKISSSSISDLHYTTQQNLSGDNSNTTDTNLKNSDFSPKEDQTISQNNTEPTVSAHRETTLYSILTTSLRIGITDTSECCSTVTQRSSQATDPLKGDARLTSSNEALELIKAVTPTLTSAPNTTYRSSKRRESTVRYSFPTTTEDLRVNTQEHISNGSETESVTSSSAPLFKLSTYTLRSLVKDRTTSSERLMPLTTRKPVVTKRRNRKRWRPPSFIIKQLYKPVLLTSTNSVSYQEITSSDARASSFHPTISTTKTAGVPRQTSHASHSTRIHQTSTSFKVAVTSTPRLAKDDAKRNRINERLRTIKSGNKDTKHETATKMPLDLIQRERDNESLKKSFKKPKRQTEIPIHFQTTTTVPRKVVGLKKNEWIFIPVMQVRVSPYQRYIPNSVQPLYRFRFFRRIHLPTDAERLYRKWKQSYHPSRYSSHRRSVVLSPWRTNTQRYWNTLNRRYISR